MKDDELIIDSNFKKFISSIPPLIKGYIRLGAFVGDGAVIDYDFNTTDICIVLPTKKVAARYMDHFDRKWYWDNYLFLLLKVFLIFLIILVLGPVQYVLVKAKLRQRTYIPIIFHKALLKILGVKVKLIGKKTSIRPLILAGNHTSYIDIIVLGSIMPICFIAKQEIKDTKIN